MFAFIFKFCLPASIPFVMLAQSMINEQTATPLTVVCGIAGACWYINGRFTRIEVVLEDLKEASDASRTHHAQLCPLCQKKDDIKHDK